MGNQCCPKPRISLHNDGLSNYGSAIKSNYLTTLQSHSVSSTAATGIYNQDADTLNDNPGNQMLWVGGQRGSSAVPSLACVSYPAPVRLTGTNDRKQHMAGRSGQPGPVNTNGYRDVAGLRLAATGGDTSSAAAAVAYGRHRQPQRYKVGAGAHMDSYILLADSQNCAATAANYSNGNMMHASLYTQSSTSNLQHISEREPDDIEDDPSLHPTKETLFMQRSVRDLEAAARKRRSICDRNAARNRQRSFGSVYRSSSSSTIQLDDSTVSRPDPKSTVRALAYAVYLQIKHRDRYYQNDGAGGLPDIFDERIYPVQSESALADHATHDPDQKAIYRFIRNLFQMAQLSPECAIVTMVYLERLLTSAETELTPVTWKRAVLCAILLASKVWDDQAVWNVDYCQILKDININDVNELERQFLEIIQFNINVPSSVYAKYYFDIRSLCGSSCQPFPLSLERAHKLEAYSRVMEDTFHEDLLRARSQRKWGSADPLTSPLRFQCAVLS